jgi:hypothetical protein
MMNRKIKNFIQYLGHDIDDEDAAERYLMESLPLVGLIVMYFNTLEKSVDSVVCEIVSDRSDEPGLIVLQGMHYSAKVDLFKRFSDSLHSCGTEPPSYRGLVETLLEVGRLRNLVVHADWKNTDEEGYTFFRIKISEKIMRQEYIQLTADALEKLLNRIKDVHAQLSDYHEEQGNLLSYGQLHIE